MNNAFGKTAARATFANLVAQHRRHRGIVCQGSGRLAQRNLDRAGIIQSRQRGIDFVRPIRR